MNAVRAAAFRSSARSRLVRDETWPRLPKHVRLEKVSGVAVDSRGFVYVAHRGENPVFRLHPDGRFDREIGAGLHRKSIGYDLRGAVPLAMDERHWMHGVHVDPWDNLWITDVGRHLIFKFSPEGVLLMTLGADGRHGCTDKLFYQPTDVCVVPSGDFFVTDGYGNSRIVKFNSRGEQLLEWGARGTGPGEFHTPHVIVLGGEGRLHVSDRENDRVQVFDQSGNLLAEWPGLHSVDGLHATPEGKILGAAGLDNAVIEFDSDGRPAQVWAEPGVFNYPHGIASDAAGNIYVAEVAGSRVLKLTPSS
ncbi:MAG: repeat domain protein [Verrucomicrobia bacterium]|nr:repeat domain protein [Verrucomicrobiota bacterium]